MTGMLPQPPPNAPPPPPGDAAQRSRSWRAWIWGVGIVSILLVLAALAAPMVIRSRVKTADIEAVSNARQIGFALFEFETTYGQFPSPATLVPLQKKYPVNTVPLGKSTSNDYFRQLLVAEIATSESMFFAKSRHGKKPDNLFDGTNALEKGECGFAYIAGLSSKNPPETPIVLCPLIPGKLQFDYKFAKKYFTGKAIILRIDNSVTSVPIDKSGNVFINGKNLFDPTQPFWNGKVPDVKWPE